MKQQTEKVISIRLIYILVFLAILIVGISLGIKYFNQKGMKQIAENDLEMVKQENISLSSRNIEETNRATSRGEKLSRNQETSQNQRNEEILQGDSTEELEENKELSQEITVNAAEATIGEEQKDVDNIEQETKYILISEVKISKNMDLTVRTGLSRENFIKLMAGVKQDTSGFFKQNAGTIYDLCKEYSLNEIFFCGIISAESGWNIAQNHRTTHNYISLMSNGKLIHYASVESGLREAAKKLHTDYLTKGGKYYYGKTLSAVKTKFCPASSTWVNLVYGRMSQIVK